MSGEKDPVVLSILRERCVQRAYDSLLGDIVVRLGLRSTLKRLYGRYLHWRWGSPVTVSVSGVESRFEVQSAAEAFEVGQNIPNERPIIKDILDEIEETAVFWDVGGFLGSYACIIGQRAKEVVVFEPDEYSITKLDRNLKLNDVAATVVDEPLGEVTGADEANDTITKQSLSGDDARREYDLPAPDIMKIDVDGPELHVVRGLKETLSESPCRLIWIEVHPNRLSNRGQSLSELTEELENLGYETRQHSFEGLGSPYVRAYRDEKQRGSR